MAIVRFGTTVIGIRGTLGGAVFTNGHAGPYVKTWRRPRNQTTAIAAIQKRNITPYGVLWSSMTTSLQNDWKAFAANPPELDFNALGLQYWLTGYQWLVRANIRRNSIGWANTTTVPANSAVTAPATCTLTTVAGNPINATVSWTAGDFPTGTGSMLQLATHPTTGLTSFPGRGILAWSTYMPAGTSHDISNAIVARFGNLPANWTLFGKLYTCRADGIRSLATPATVRIT